MVKLGQLEKVTDTALQEMMAFQSAEHGPVITSTPSSPRQPEWGHQAAHLLPTEKCKGTFLILVGNLIDVFIRESHVK